MADVEVEQVKHMVERFLAWKLPENFHPDAGISFKATFNDTPAAMAALGLTEPMRHNPTGTNLFDYTQAKEMVEHMLEGLPAALATGRDDKLAGDELNAASFARLWSNYCDVKSERDDLRERLSALATGRDDKLAGELETLIARSRSEGSPADMIGSDGALALFMRTNERAILSALRASTHERNAVIEELGKALDDICRNSNPDWTEKRRYPRDVLDDIHKTAVDAYYGPLRALKDAPDA